MLVKRQNKNLCILLNTSWSIEEKVFPTYVQDHNLHKEISLWNRNVEQYNTYETGEKYIHVSIQIMDEFTDDECTETPGVGFNIKMLLDQMMIDWLIDWMISQLIDWLTYWLIDW